MPLIHIEIFNLDLEKPALSFITEAAAEYTKRLQRYAQLQYGDSSSIDNSKLTINNQTLTIHVGPRGESLSSEALASLLRTAAVSGKSRIRFMITAGNLAADRTIALSKMDIDPSLQTVLLLEQIYRAFRIIHNEPYHK